MENFSVATIVGHYFFMKGPLSTEDFAEYIKHFSIANDHITSAEHFLQRVFFFDHDIRDTLDYW